MRYIHIVFGIVFILFIAAVGVSVLGYQNAKNAHAELAQRYVATEAMQTALDGMYKTDAYEILVRDGIERKYASKKLSEDQLDRIVALMLNTTEQDREIMERHMIASAPAYFSPDELEQMIAYWDSEVSKRIMAKTITMEEELIKMVQAGVTYDKLQEFAGSYFTDEEKAAATTLDTILGGAEAGAQKANAHKAAYKEAATQEMAVTHAGRGEKVLAILAE